MNILTELEWRGLIADCTDAPTLRQRPQPITLYCGFDPTADSLHVGHLVPLLALLSIWQPVRLVPEAGQPLKTPSLLLEACLLGAPLKLMPTGKVSLMLMAALLPAPVPAEDVAAAGEGLDIAAFEEPPLRARPRAYWDWINGAVTLDQLTRDLEEMKDKGIEDFLKIYNDNKK